MGAASWPEAGNRDAGFRRDPSKAVSFAKELVYNDKVDVVCGPINSGEVLPTLGIISGAKTMQMVGGVIDELTTL